MIADLLIHTPGDTLPQQWKRNVIRSGSTVRATVFNQRLEEDPSFEQIMFYLDLGTSDHWIFPVNAQALSWIDEESGERYFSKGHRVTGITASYFRSRANVVVLRFTGTINQKLTHWMNTGQYLS
jgi:hypothetical protein